MTTVTARPATRNATEQALLWHTAVLVGALLRHRPWAYAGHWLVGAALAVWIVVQVGFLGWPPHWLQILYFCYGLAILTLARLAPRYSAGSLPGNAPPGSSSTPR